LRRRWWAIGLPKEVFDPDEFLELAEKASECRVKRLGDVMKLKLRTRRQLYTIKLETAEGEELLNKIGCTKVEY
jgi:large subunit ribosomal protein L38e